MGVPLARQPPGVTWQWRAVLAGAVVLVVGLGSAACEDDDATSGGKGVAVGDVIEGATYLSDDGRQYTLWLPVGETTFEVVGPFYRLGAGDTDSGKVVEAPSGTALLGIEWKRTDSYIDSDLEEMVTGTDDAAKQDPARLWVVADGKRREVPDVGTLGGPTGRPSPLYVVVPDEASQLSLEVEHSGLTQTIDLTAGRVKPGRGAELAGVTEQTGVGLDFVDCSRGLTGLLAQLATCSVDGRWSTPYLHDQGWAKPGTTWVVVHAGVMLGGPGIVGTDLDARLDGRGPVAAEVGESRDVGTDKRFVFEAPTHGKRVLDLRVRLDREQGEDLVGTGRTSLLDD